MLTTRWLPESSISYINSLFHVSSFPLSFFFVRVARLSLVSSRKHGLCLPPPLCIFSLKLRIPKSQFNRCSDGVLQSWKKKHVNVIMKDGTHYYTKDYSHVSSYTRFSRSKNTKTLLEILIAGVSFNTKLDFEFSDQHSWFLTAKRWFR